MNIKNDELEQLLRAAANTCEHELTCNESGELVHRYVDFRVFGTGEMPEELRGVQQHVSVCPGCREIVESIIAAVRAEQGLPPA